MKKVILLLDYATINRSSSDLNLHLNYGHLKYYIGRDDRNVMESFCYIPIDPRNEHRLDRETEDLQRAGYYIVTKVGKYIGDSFKCSFEVEITLDAMRIAALAKPDIIILASDNKDFVPLVLELRRMGIKVECALFEGSNSRDIILNCSGFIDLNMYYEDYQQEVLSSGKVIDQNAHKEEIVSEFEELPISDEEVESAVKKLEKENLESLMFEDFPNYLLIRDGTAEAREIREGDKFYFEFENEGKMYLIYKGIISLEDLAL